MSTNRRFGRMLAASTAAATAFTLAPVAMAQETVEFSLSNFTDFHGRLEESVGDDLTTSEMGAARLSALAKHVNEGQEYALLSSGDNVGGSAFISAISEDEYTIQALNAMGVDYSAVGNHEFDKGYSDLTGRIQPKSEFPILGANVYKGTERALEPYKIEELNGVKVAIVGTVTEATAQKVSPAALEGISFTDPAEETNKVAKELKASGKADVVVALMHEDAEGMKDKFSADVDVVFGGDTHQKTMGTTPMPYAQSLEYGKVLTDLDITYDKTAKKIVDVKQRQYTYEDAAALTPDAAVASIVAEAKAKAEELGENVVASVDKPMFRGSDEGKDSGSNRGVESTLNNFLAQASLVALEQVTGQDIDFGVMNAGGVRADLAAGDVTYSEAFAVQPFGNGIAYAEFSGEEILKALENQWKAEGEKRPRLSMGLSQNVSYTYNPEAPRGEKIINVMIDGEKLDPAATYTVAGSTFLLRDGGDGYFSEGDAENLVDVGLMDVDGFIKYLKADEAAVPEGQQAVGVKAPETAEAGETITVDLSSLNYTTEGEPMATTATVALGDETVEAAIDNAAQEGDAQFGERGRASVQLTVPEDVCGEQNLLITTDSKTTVMHPITIGDPAECPEPNGGSTGSADGSSTGFGIAAIAGLIAAVLGVLNFGTDMNWNIIPAPVRKAVKDFRASMGSSR